MKVENLFQKRFLFQTYFELYNLKVILNSKELSNYKIQNTLENRFKKSSRLAPSLPSTTHTLTSDISG